MKNDLAQALSELADWMDKHNACFTTDENDTVWVQMFAIVSDDNEPSPEIHHFCIGNPDNGDQVRALIPSRQYGETK